MNIIYFEKTTITFHHDKNVIKPFNDLNEIVTYPNLSIPLSNNFILILF